MEKGKIEANRFNGDFNNFEVSLMISALEVYCHHSQERYPLLDELLGVEKEMTGQIRQYLPITGEAGQEPPDNVIPINKKSDRL